MVNRKIKYVYDFDTAEGNGTIACVCLTHAYGGYTTYGTSYKWIIKIDAANDSAYYFTITSTTSIKIVRYRANINTVSLFDNPSTTRLLEETDVTFSTAISQQYFAYNYEEETDKLYIMSASSYSVSNNGSYVITEIDMSNDNAVKQYSMTNKTGTSIRLAYDKGDSYCYRGYIYFQNYNLSTPVLKTADKTMKVTYTLQEQ